MSTRRDLRVAEQIRRRARVRKAQRVAAPLALIAVLTTAWAAGSGAPAEDEVVLTTSPAPAATAAPTTTVTATVTADPGTPDPVAVALTIKPLRDIAVGDRVIYTAEPGGTGTACTWAAWGGDIAISTIDCNGEVFDVPTGYLTPVEAR